MKAKIHLLALVTILIISCGRQENKELLLQMNSIKALGDSLPKEAILRLDSLEPLCKEESEYIRNKYLLLKIRLNDKAYITHTSDSVIKTVCGYFEENGDEREKQEAYYYMGRVYSDLNDSPNAVTYFLKSINCAENCENGDSAILSVSFSQLYGLYKKQHLFNASLEMALKALNIAERINKNNANDYSSVASAYYHLNDTANAILYSRKAVNFIIDRNSIESDIGIIANSMLNCANLGYMTDADYYYGLIKNFPENKAPHNYLVCMLWYYESNNMTDSVNAVAHRLFDNATTVEMKFNAAQTLCINYAKQKDYKNATAYAIHYISANTKIARQYEFEHTVSKKNLFKYNRDKEEELIIMQKAEQHKNYLLMCILLFVLVLLAITLFFYINKRKLLENILKKEEDIKNAQELIERQDKELNGMQQGIEENKRELESRTATNLELSMQLQRAKKDFEMLVAQNRDLTRIAIMDNISGNYQEIIDKCKETAKGKYTLNEKDWKELLGAIDNLYPNFTKDIQVHFKRIKEPMLRVCYLMKIGLNGPQIANLTGYPRQTVWDRMRRINNTMGLKADHDK